MVLEIGEEDDTILPSEMRWIRVVEWAKVVMIMGPRYPHLMKNSPNGMG